MREQPFGSDLLDCARNHLKEQLLPFLSGDQKHSVLMVMNAMAIVSRQFRNGAEPDQEELESLRHLLGADAADLISGGWQLVALIRNGAGDPGQPERKEIFRHLQRVAERRVSESNPKALKDPAA